MSDPIYVVSNSVMENLGRRGEKTLGKKTLEEGER